MGADHLGDIRAGSAPVLNETGREVIEWINPAKGGYYTKQVPVCDTLHRIIDSINKELRPNLLTRRVSSSQ